MGSIDYALDNERILAMGRLLSEEFDGVDPKYMVRDSVSIESLGMEKAVVHVTLRKVISWNKAINIINGREQETND